MSGEIGLKERVLKQITYYFSDNNLMRDKFMKTMIKEDDGWISLDCLLTFNRLKKLCDDKNKILEFLQDQNGTFFEINSEKMSIRRNKDLPLPELTPKEHYSNIRPQTVLLKGFPQEQKINIDIIEKCIQENKIENVCDIRMMRNGLKEFLGKVYVQFNTEEIAKKFIQDETPLKFNFDEKEIEITKITLDDHRNKSKQKKAKNARERFYDQIGYDDNDCKSAKGGFQPGKLVYFSNAPETITRELIKSNLKDLSAVKWLEFNKGDTEGVIELEEGGSAYKLEQKMKEQDDNFVLKVKAEEGDEIMAELKLRVVDGQEEINFWRLKLDKRKNKNKNFSKKRMRTDPKSVKPEGKLTKFSDNESADE